MVNVKREVRRWNKFHGKYVDFANDEGKEDPAWEEVHNQVQSFQGRVVVRSRHAGGVCEHCHDKVAQIAVHVEKRVGQPWAVRNEWGNVKVVCFRCRQKIVDSRVN